MQGKPWCFVTILLVLTLVGSSAFAQRLYPGPPSWWAYFFDGDTAAPGGGFGALDGTWSHDNGSDEWDETAIGEGRPGGASALTEDGTTFLRLQDTGDPRDHGQSDPGSNRKIMFGHTMGGDIDTGVAQGILDDGVTITFRARIPTSGPLDDIHPDGGGDVSPYPAGGDGYLPHDGGKDNFNVRQSDGDQLVSFALALASDDDELDADGLVMNKLNGTSPSGDVDLQGDEAGTVNILELDPTVWHEFWITIEADDSGQGTHMVNIYVDGSMEPATFYVTAGDGDDYSESYIAMGVGATPQSGAIDIDFFAYKPGAFKPDGIYKAGSPDPADGTEGLVMTLFQWKPGSDALFHDVYLGTSPELTAADLVMPRYFMTLYYHPTPLTPGMTYYWRIDEIQADGTVTEGDVWSFTTAPLEAFQPQPYDGARWADVETDLAWTPGQGAVTHDVYFGTDEAAVADGTGDTFKASQAAMAFELDTLAPGTTYYWRIDEVEADGTTKHPGAVWSFTTVGPGGGVKGAYFANMTLSGDPIVTRTDQQIDFTWADGVVTGENSPAEGIPTDGFSCRWTADFQVDVASTYELITTSDDGVRLYLDGALVIDNWTDHSSTDNYTPTLQLVPDRVYSLVMEMYENGGGAVAQLSWESDLRAREIIPAGALQPPLHAGMPSPAEGAVDVPQDVTLSWTAGDQATGHRVFFGDDADVVAAATAPNAQQALANTSYSPGMLEWNKTYYWRVDEVGPAGPGSVWSFTTADFILVDDFESYSNVVGERAFEVWIDGIGFSMPDPGSLGNGTGAGVGHDIWDPASPYYNGLIMEVDNPYSGNQALPIYYNNTAMPYRSEVERTWSPVRDWTLNGVDSLVLYVRGAADNAADPLYIAIQDGAGRVGVAEADPSLITSTRWNEWRIPLSEFSNAGVNLAAVKKMVIGVGSRNGGVPGGTGVIFVDDIRVVKPEPVE